MRSHLAMFAALLWLAGCTRTLESSQRHACPPPRAHTAGSGIGIIGMSLDRRVPRGGEPEIFVDRVVPDGPAAMAGIRPGDRILTIEGSSTRGWSIADAARRMRGPTGDAVRLEIASGEQARAVMIVRVAPSELWTGSAAAAHEAERVRASDVAPAAPVTAPPCRH